MQMVCFMTSTTPMKNLDYGIIGNCKTAALVSRTGSIDWCCLPDFDSGSFFAHILDKENGGFFSIEPVGRYRIEQTYLNRTNILRTRFTRNGDSFEILDFMPRYLTEERSYHCPPDIIRYIRVLSGQPQICVHYNPRPNYAEHPTDVQVTLSLLSILPPPASTNRYICIPTCRSIRFSNKHR